MSLIENSLKNPPVELTNSKVENYLSQMPSGIELSKIPPQQQAAVEAWSRSQKMKYAEAAKNMSI